MRTKNIILFSLISTFFLIFLISIWKILATLQGLSINSFNIEIIFIFGFLISLVHLVIGDRIKSIYKSIIFSSIFVFCDGYLIQKLPIWYNVGVFLILYFFITAVSGISSKNLSPPFAKISGFINSKLLQTLLSLSILKKTSSTCLSAATISILSFSSIKK